MKNNFNRLLSKMFLYTKKLTSLIALKKDSKPRLKNNETKDFIESIKFEYFETYSFQRKGDLEIYTQLLKKYKDEDSLLDEEKAELKRLRKLSLYVKDDNFIFTDNGELNATADLICRSDKSSNLNNELIEILKIPFVDYIAYMCPPIYRDAILFYDADNKLVDGINICFECGSVIDLNKKEILTDNVVYEKLKDFLRLHGHKID